MDSKIVQVALSGLENILRIGKQDAFQNDGINQFAVMVEEAYGKSLGCHATRAKRRSAGGLVLLACKGGGGGAVASWLVC